MLYIYTATEIEGSQFLIDNWTKPTPITADGYYFPKMDLKFDIVTNIIIYNKNDTAFEFTPQINVINVYPNEIDTNK